MNFLSGQRFEFNHRIVKFLALTAQDGLDGDVPAAIGATRHAGAITAFGTFKEIRAAHVCRTGVAPVSIFKGFTHSTKRASSTHSERC